MSDRNPLVDFLMGAGKQLITRAANGAAEAVLDEVQGAVKEVDRRITKARVRAKTRSRHNSIEDAEVIVEEVKETH